MSSGTRRISTLFMAAILVGLMLPASVAVAADLIPTSLDLEAPTIVELGEPLTMTATVSPDPGGGWITFSVDGTAKLTTQVPLGGVISFTFDDGLSYYGQHLVAVTYNGSATHNGSYDQALIDVLDDRTPVTVSLTSSPNPALRGEPITFSISVSPNPHGGDIGEIELRHGGSQLEVGSLDGSGHATLETSFGASGSIEIVACFVGNDTHQQACSAPLDQVVYGITSTTTLAIEPATVYPDESTTVSVTVSPAPETATTVWVGTSPFHNRIPVGVSGPAGYGEVTLTSDLLTHDFVLGHQYDMRAYFPGTAQLEPSTSNLVQFQIRLDQPTLLANVDAAERHVGDPITFSASVTPLPIVESAGVGFWVNGPASSGFGDHVAVELGLDGTGQATVDTDGWPAGDYWYDAACCGDPHLAPTTQRGTFTLIDEDAPAGGISVAGGLPVVTNAGVAAQVPATDGVGSGVQVVALSNDGSTWTTMPYDDEVDWALAGGDGVRTVRAKWQDQAGNWSVIQSDTIVLDTTGPVGSVTIAGGATYTKSTSVTIATAATDAGAGLSKVALSNDGVNWTTRTYAASLSWTLPPSNGTKTVRVKWQDNADRWSAVKTDTIVLDTVAPTATEPRRGFVVDTAISSGKISLRVPWSGSDATSGIARYELAQSTDGGAWTTVSTTLTSATATRSLESLHTYQFRARAVDQAGNTGAWATGATFRISRYSEFNSAIAYSGSWTNVSSPAYWGGAAKKSSTAGARASITFTGRSIAWVARTGPDRGKAAIYVNGTKVATVDLYSATAQAQRVVWVGSWTTAVARKVTIRVAGTVGRPRIDLDALVTAN